MRRFPKSMAVAATIFAAALALGCSKPSEGGNDLKECCSTHKSLDLDSRVMGSRMRYSVLLPPDFDFSGKEKYYILYLLHGYGDNETSWIDKPSAEGGQKSIATVMDEALAGGSIPRTVVIMPDGQVSFYKGDWEKYFYSELMPFVEKKFHIDSRRECRAIAGLSMGGFGAAYHALSHPELYCYAFTMSQAGGADLNALAAKAEKDKLPYFYITNGDSDTVVGKAPDEFYALLQQYGIKSEFEHWPGGHTWKFWGECIPKFINKIGEEFKR